MVSQLNFDENGWFFVKPPEKPTNDIHDITGEDIERLLQLADEEDEWARSIANQVKERDYRLEHRLPSLKEFILDEMLIVNSGGTAFPFPYGVEIITFPSKRHLFRGENKQYQQTIPSLNRILVHISDPKEQELYRAIAYMRKWQFASLIWQINVVPYWEAKLSDNHYDALAQHYGFPTHLLDLTNDFRTALFFATCKYNANSNSFEPLTNSDIEQNEESRYGCIFHSPDWKVDYFNGGGFSDWFYKHPITDEQQFLKLQSGDMDGVAMRIGYQPLYRCHAQSGFIYPMRNAIPLQQDVRFEKMRFRHSARLSQRIFDLMDNGKKIFPQEGISAIHHVLNRIKHSVVFSIDDVECAFGIDGIDRNIFPTLGDLKSALQGFRTVDGVVVLQEEPVVRKISPIELAKVNALYDEIDLLKMVGGMIHRKPDSLLFRKQRCKEIYGKLI